MAPHPRVDISRIAAWARRFDAESTHSGQSVTFHYAGEELSAAPSNTGDYFYVSIEVPLSQNKSDLASIRDIIQRLSLRPGAPHKTVGYMAANESVYVTVMAMHYCAQGITDHQGNIILRRLGEIVAGERRTIESAWAQHRGGAQ
ncbi:MAG: hypothetical protein Q4C87_00400 [Actinomycetaceae bacterium]|nr:hypothetical protein [Actinomycetaceae bacterium]